VYYNGNDSAKDQQVAARLFQWLGERMVDLVVVERLFDAAPIHNHVRQKEERACLLVSRGDSFDPIDGVDLAIAAVPSATRSGKTKRSPTVAELAATFEGMLAAMARGDDPADSPGVSRITNGRLAGGSQLDPNLTQDFSVPLPTLEQEVIVLGSAPPIIRKTVFGNSGCPYGADPAENPHFEGIQLEEGAAISRLGCAFCCMGGDYQKRPDEEVVASIVAQALHLTRDDAAIEELVLSDQYPIRYLATLIERADKAGVRPLRWLFAARCDAFVKERTRIRSAVETAAQTGHVLELYLSGFESFCDADLIRYNKGITVADQLAAVAAMRELKTEFPTAFEYGRARGHSLILWNPWSTPENLLSSMHTMRRHGLGELFHDVGRNRLRLYNDLPITQAVKRDGALTHQWDDGDEGAGRRKGYNPELPWRFLDNRMRTAYGLAGALRESLGPTTELSQLAAVAKHCAGTSVDASENSTLLDQLNALNEGINFSCGPNRSSPPHGLQERAQVVLFTDLCNNACPACSNRDQWQSNSKEALFSRVDAARNSGLPVLLAGREPTLHPDFLEILARASGDDHRRVGLVTNGRRFSYNAFTVAALQSGLRAVSLKLFGATAETADNYSRDPGAFDQAMAGARTLLKAGLPALEVRTVLHHQLLAEIESLPALVQQIGASQLRVEVALDAIGLSKIHELMDGLTRLQSQCITLNLPLEISPLSAGTYRFEWMPALKA
jgi:pyruvate-formate lyase-activating enzyme